MDIKYIKTNPTFYLVAPSFGCTTSPYDKRLKKALKTFSKLKINTIIGPNCFKNEGIASSNTPYLRAQEFHDAYSSNADVIISVGGGELMFDILQHIDFDLIKTKPFKWFIGFSDNTNLTYTLTTICDIPTIYGPNAPSFYSYPLQYDTLDLLRLLRGEKIFYGYEGFMLEKSKALYPKYNFDHKKVITSYFYTKPFNGILLGGCLDCLVNICGTKFDNTKTYINNHKDKGIIFYFEACDLNSVGIKRALLKLKYSGWFDNNIKGFLIGRSLNYFDESFGLTSKQAYLSELQEYKIPILLDIDLGHIDPSLPIKNGGYATISYENNNIKIEYLD